MIKISLINILYTNLTNENFSIKLTKEEIVYIHNLIEKNSIFFHEIEEQINNIDNDNNADYHDIPQIVLLIANKYHLNISKESIDNISLINIVQFTLDSMFDLNLVEVSKSDAILIKKLIDSSIKLLKMNSNFVKEESDCCTYMFGFEKYIRKSNN